MIEELIDEYLAHAEAAATVDYADEESVRQFNAGSDRMRAIVDEVVSLGQNAIRDFSSILEVEPAAVWAAHQLVEKATLDAATRSKCLDRVKKARIEAEAKGNLADAMGEAWWLEKWKPDEP